MNTINIKNVNKSFGKGEGRFQVLDDINFQAKPGEFNIITGPSGSGKSTLLTIMGALRKPDSGTVLLENRNIYQEKNHERENFRLNQIGFILQAHNLVPFLNVSDQFVLVDKIRKRGNLTPSELTSLLKELDIDNLLKRYPDELSGGQSQRVTIARGLYTKPSIILADEPTAALDPLRVKQVCQKFYDLAKKENKTIVVVTHDARVNKYADHIYELVAGKMTQEK